MLVKELMQQTMIESLLGGDKAQGSHCHACINSLSTRRTLSRGAGGRDGAILHPAAARRWNTFKFDPFFLKNASEFQQFQSRCNQGSIVVVLPANVYATV